MSGLCGVKGKTVSIFLRWVRETEINRIRIYGRDFTRKGKIGPHRAVFQLLSSSRQSLEGEVLDLMRRTDMEKVSDAALSKARDKIGLGFLSSLLKKTIRSFQERNSASLSTFGGYRVIAIDGSILTLPKGLDRKELVVKTHVSPERKTVYQLEVQEAFDMVNGTVVDFQISSRKNEHAMAIANIENTEKLDGSPKIYVFDRGYVDIRIMDRIMQKGQFFVIRLKSSTLRKEQEGLRKKSGDIEVDRTYDKAMASAYRKDGKFYERLLGRKYHLRLVRFEVGNGTVETLVTNLMPDRMASRRLREIYHMRWGVETDYRNAKQRDMLDRFTGRRLYSVLQDIYAAEIMHVLTLMSIWEAGYRRKRRKMKHPMKINYASASRNLRKSRILDTLAKEADDFPDILSSFMDGLEKKLVPIRENRKGRPRVLSNTSKGDTYKK